MPTVKPYNQPTVAVNPLQVAKNTTQIRPSLTDNSLAQGIVDVGSAVQEINRKVDETKLIQAETLLYSRADDLLFNKDNGYYNNKGEAAFNGVEDINKQLDKIKEEIASSLSSDQQRQQFSLLADKRLVSDRRGISQHASKELEVWDRMASEARIENAIESASLNYTPESIRENMIRLDDEILAQAEKEGAAPEVRKERLETGRSKLLAGAMMNAANLYDMDSAKALDAKYGKFLEPDDRQVVDAKLKSIGNNIEAQQLADSIRNAGGTRSERLAAVNTIEDPEIRKLVRSQAISDFEQEETAKTERQADAYNTVYGEIVAGTPITAAIQRNPAKWDAMTPTQKAAIIKAAEGKPVDTNIAVYDKLTGLIQSNNIKEARQYFMANVHQLDETDQKHFSKLTQDTDQDTGLFTVQDIVRNELKDIKDVEQTRLFMRDMDRWYYDYLSKNDGKEPPNQEVYRKMDEMMQMDAPWFGRNRRSFVNRAINEPKRVDEAVNVYAEVFGEAPDLSDVEWLQTQINIWYESKGEYPKPSEIRKTLTKYKEANSNNNLIQVND